MVTEIEVNLICLPIRKVVSLSLVMTQVTLWGGRLLKPLVFFGGVFLKLSQWMDKQKMSFKSIVILSIIVFAI
jgi:hypothetical protein